MLFAPAVVVAESAAAAPPPPPHPALSTTTANTGTCSDLLPQLVLLTLVLTLVHARGLGFRV